MIKPALSVVIPTYNRALVLERCLECLTQQTFPYDRFEVLVVDDGSKDNTRVMLNKKAFPFRLRPIFENHGGAARARNQGIRKAEGDIVVFTDDDCLPTRSFLERHWEAHENRGNRLARGPVLIVRAVHETARVRPSLLSFSMNYFCTSNASLAKAKLLEAGGFDESFARWEDAELGVRLRKLGLRMTFDMQAVVHHLKPTWRLRDLIETAIRDGRSAEQVFKRHPSLRTWLSGGLHPLSRLTGMALRHWVDRKVTGMKPDEPVSGILERAIFHSYFVEGLTLQR